jgi:hypothetical protein
MLGVAGVTAMDTRVFVGLSSPCLEQDKKRKLIPQNTIT